MTTGAGAARRAEAGGQGLRDTSRSRIRLALVLFAVGYMVIAGRLVLLGLDEPGAAAARGNAASAIAAVRPDLVDRNGEVLVTDIKTASLYAEPRRIVDPDEASELITSVLPDVDARALRNRLAGDAGFTWIKRELTPRQQSLIHSLGVPGIGFLPENQRFYPGGRTAAHILGHVDIDNRGIAGIEKRIDDDWLGELHKIGFANNERLDPVRLSVDLRVQHVLHDELSKAMERYHAIAASGVILDVHTGEVMAMASLPDYDPNQPADALKPDRLNRVTAGVFELGSVFKTFTVAMALDNGTATMESRFDATRGLRYGGFTINDFHGKHRVLTVPEVFIYSSNIGAARMALASGGEVQREFLERLGMGKRLQTEIPEVAAPLLPSRWAEVTTVTVSFGHGISVTPMHMAVAAASLVNGGKLIPPTFFPRDEATAQTLAKQVISKDTSDKMRMLFRLNVEKGSGRQAEAPGYIVGGKTGTAEKVVNGRYVGSKRLNSFLAAFPMDDPQYVVLIVIDEPQPEKPGMGATAGVNAAPVVGAVVRRSAAMLGVSPRGPAVARALIASY